MSSESSYRGIGERMKEHPWFVIANRVGSAELFAKFETNAKSSDRWPRGSACPDLERQVVV